MLFFEILPLELKNQIYDYCLIHPEVLIPFPTNQERRVTMQEGQKPAKDLFGRSLTYYKNSRKAVVYGRGSQNYAHDWPCMALLGVNQTIQQEAAVILFGKNTWRISCPVDESEELQEDFYRRYKTHFRHVTIYFHFQDTEPSNQTKFFRRPNGEQRSRYRRLHAVHDSYLEGMGRAWGWRVIIATAEISNLKTLVFDVTELYYPIGCCRLGVLEKLRDHFAPGGKYLEEYAGSTFPTPWMNPDRIVIPDDSDDDLNGLVLEAGGRDGRAG